LAKTPQTAAAVINRKKGPTHARLKSYRRISISPIAARIGVMDPQYAAALERPRMVHNGFDQERRTHVIHGNS
jgi:hypothetical protein